MMNEATFYRQGSPCIFKAAYMLCTNSNLLLSNAMKIAGYKRKEISTQWIRQISQKRKAG
jgi:hypothetical protein